MPHYECYSSAAPDGSGDLGQPRAVASGWLRRQRGRGSVLDHGGGEGPQVREHSGGAAHSRSESAASSLQSEAPCLAFPGFSPEPRSFRKAIPPPFTARLALPVRPQGREAAPEGEWPSGMFGDLISACVVRSRRGHGHVKGGESGRRCLALTPPDVEGHEAANRAAFQIFLAGCGGWSRPDPQQDPRCRGPRQGAAGGSWFDETRQHRALTARARWGGDLRSAVAEGAVRRGRDGLGGQDAAAGRVAVRQLASDAGRTRRREGDPGGGLRCGKPDGHDGVRSGYGIRRSRKRVGVQALGNAPALPEARHVGGRSR